MIPIMVAPTAGAIVIVGGGGGALQRLRLVDEYAAPQVHVFAETADAEVVTLAGARLTARWPTAEDFARLVPRIVFIADLGDEQSTPFIALAHRVGALVNVHDRTPLCDFHVPARLRRGKLQVTVSTDGAAPALASLMRDRIGRSFGPEWGERIDRLGALRSALLAQGVRGAQLSQRLAAEIDRHQWLH
ncbi:MAG: NAD(P)-dependent oxidoreductase [Rhodospirillaceae bacterium]|nr:NAD(P)-dependent oxidoreductase [Rhodospirillaceae bacterium]